MDTNLLNLIVTLSQQKGASGGQVLPVVTIVLYALGPLLAGVAAWFSAKTAKSTEEIHKAVNSERDAMLAKVEARDKEILRITSTVSALEEKNRGKEVADALKTPLV